MRMTPIITLICLYFSMVSFSMGQGNMKVFSPISMNSDEQIGIYADLYSTATDLDLIGEVHFNTVNSLVQSPTSISINTIEFNMEEALNVETELIVKQDASFNSGVVYTDRSNLDNHFVHFLHNTSYVGLSNNTYVDGTVGKTGNTSFVYPIGHNFNVSTLTMTAPTDLTASYKSYFLEDDVATILNPDSKSDCVGLLTENGYWLFNQIATTDKVSVDLAYDPGMLVNDVYCENLITSYDSALQGWVSEGNGGITGDNDAGGVISSGTGCGDCGTGQEVNNYTFLTIAAPILALPVHFVSFDGELFNESYVAMEWIVSNEDNNDYFVIEQSTDGINWTESHIVQSLGDTTTERTYSQVDFVQNVPKIYYRLKQVDNNGHSSYFDNVLVFDFDRQETEKFFAYPNPIKDFVFLELTQNQVGNSLRVIDPAGRIKMTTDNSSATQSLDFSGLPKGAYIIQLYNPSSLEIISEVKVVKY